MAKRITRGDNEERAREAVRRILKGAKRSLSKDGNRTLFRRHLAAQGPEFLVAVAREGSPQAVELLREYARGASRAGILVPASFHEFVWEWFIDGPPKALPGPKSQDTEVLRDPIIVALVKVVSKTFGLSPTRNDATRKMSACGIIADEISKLGIATLSERGVKDIWDHRIGA
jgi:hypothetical protein